MINSPGLGKGSRRSESIFTDTNNNGAHGRPNIITVGGVHGSGGAPPPYSQVVEYPERPKNE